MVNNSLSTVYYQWQEVCIERVHITVEPSEGYIGNLYVIVNVFYNYHYCNYNYNKHYSFIVPDGVGHCELIIRPLLAGDIVVDLHCIILHRSQPLVMCIRATAQVSP